jgi:hypothetical protein
VITVQFVLSGLLLESRLKGMAVAGQDNKTLAPALSIESFGTAVRNSVICVDHVLGPEGYI